MVGRVATPETSANWGTPSGNDSKLVGGVTPLVNGVICTSAAVVSDRSVTFPFQWMRGA